MPAYRATAQLLKDYRLKKNDISKRLESFKKLDRLSERQVFEELAFCIFTPGSKALNGDKAVKELKRQNLLFKGNRDSIAKGLRGIVRFHNNKALYLTQARRYFKKGLKFNIKSFVLADNPIMVRERLAQEVKGIGYKEASHFLRNIGLGRDLAILDTHILKNLKRLNIITEIPVSMGEKKYLDLESKMNEFSKYVKIPIAALDLLFWSHETGFIYK